MTVWALSPRARPPGALFPRTTAASYQARSTRIRQRLGCVSYAALLLYSARLGHDLRVPARQFGNPAPLAAFDGILVNQVPPDAQRHRARTNEIQGVHLIHTAGSNQWDVREGPLESLDVGGAAVRKARKDLHEIGTSLPGGRNLGGRQGAREDHHPAPQRKVDDLKIESRRGQEDRAGIQAAACRFHVK